jgi:hypothetical protein
MSQARVRISLGIILAAVVIAATITTWATSPIAGTDSARPSQASEAIYRPQHLLLY